MEDNIEAIYKTCSDLARTFSYGGGVGIDISKLRPINSYVNNTARKTSGACSFMDTFSQVTETIGQNGRRGALMISMSCTHPEIEEFINIKTDLNRVTKANISVRITDDFMRAVENNEDWELYFKTKHEEIKKIVKAKDIFRLLCKNNHEMAEPGILFWDRISNYNILSEDEEFEYAGTNPCFTGDMKLLTTNGYRTFEELCDTEPMIFDIEGGISKSKVWCSGEKETIKLIMSNGKTITCTPNHVFLTIDGEEVEAKDLKGKKIQLNTMFVRPIDNEYIKLGFIQGDGVLTTIKNKNIVVDIGAKDYKILDLFDENHYVWAKNKREIYVDDVRDTLINLGFTPKPSYERDFPTEYKNFSLNQKANFLQGCFTANGCVIKKYRVSYKTTSPSFALHLQETLLNDFGIHSNITINKPKKYGEYVCRESYDICINKIEDIIRFAENINFYYEYKELELEDLINYRTPYVRNIKKNGVKKVYDFTEPNFHWGIVEGRVAHNCAEEPLPAGGSCLLGALNLSAYVENGEFNFPLFTTDVHKAVKGLNEVLDEGLPLHPLEIQRETVRDYRQIGLGVMGIADMLIKLGIKYDSDQALELCDVIGFVLANSALEASALLAKEEGFYPKYNREAVLHSDFILDNTTNDVYELIIQHGLRNSQVLTIAPTGSISTMIEVSGGIEPIFSFSYDRKTESLHGEEVHYKVYTKIVKDYMETNGLYEEGELPNFFVNAQTIDPFKRVEMQGVWQEHIDASISSTVNLPNETTVEDVENLYMYAWKKGLKGMTIFRDGCARLGILTLGDKKEEEEIKELRRGEWKSLADDTYYVKRKLTIGCGTLKLFIGYSPNEQAIQDLYIVKSGSGGCEKNLQAIAISMSALLRVGGNIEQLEKAFSGIGVCPSFVSARAKGIPLSKGNYCGMAIINEVKTFLSEINGEQPKVQNKKEDNVIEKNKKLIGLEKCPECGEKTLLMTGGCMQCTNCSYTKCE